MQALSAEVADPARRWINASLLAVVVAGVYMLSARLSLALLTPDGVAVFWPAAGIAAGTLIAFGPATRWPVVAGTMFATIAANLLGDRNIPSAVVFALCNAGEAVLAAYLIERYFGSPFSLDRLSHVLGLLGGGGRRHARPPGSAGRSAPPSPAELDLRDLGTGSRATAGVDRSRRWCRAGRGGARAPARAKPRGSRVATLVVASAS